MSRLNFWHARDMSFSLHVVTPQHLNIQVHLWLCAREKCYLLNDGMGGAVEDAGCGIEPETPVVD